MKLQLNKYKLLKIFYQKCSQFLFVMRFPVQL